MLLGCVDLILSWSVKTKHFNGKLYALTHIDTATNVLELACIDTKSSDAIKENLKTLG